MLKVWDEGCLLDPDSALTVSLNAAFRWSQVGATIGQVEEEPSNAGGSAELSDSGWIALENTVCAGRWTQITRIDG